MADVTAKLLWYRLNESTEHLVILWDGLQYMATAGGTVLNYVFIFWILFGLLTILVVTVLQHNVGLEHKQRDGTQSCSVNKDYICKNCRGSTTNMIKINATSSSVETNYLNSCMEWLNIVNSQWKVPITEKLLATMTEESRKIGGDLFVTFEALMPVGDAPLLNITSAANGANGNTLILEGELQLSSLQLSLTTSDNSVSLHSNILLVIHLLKSKLEIEVDSTAECISFNVRAGEMIAMDIQFSPYYQGVDCITDERKLTQHVTSIFANLTIPLKIAIHTEEVVTEPTHVSDYFVADPMTNGMVPPKPPRSIEDKKLMIKLIKATKLNRRNIAAMDAFCIVEVDKPFQTHSTSIVKNTVNPYWDEHFLFDLGSCTKSITFRVYGNSKDIHSKDINDNRNCLGESQVDLEKLRYNHGIRMVLPLKSSAADVSTAHPVSGSVTIEAFFVDSAEFESPLLSEVDDVFAQSVEPLVTVSDVEIESPTIIFSSFNDDSRPSSLSLSDSTSKLTKTSTHSKKENASQDENEESGSIPEVVTSETIHSMTLDDSSNLTQDNQGLNLGIDMNNAEVITVYPNQSVTEVVLKELKERSSRQNNPNSRTTSTIIITAAPRSDDSSGGTPSINWDISQQQQTGSQDTQQVENRQQTPVSQLPTALPPSQGRQIQIPSAQEHLDIHHTTERKSRLSGLKKRFTKTKDKKARSHSVERSSGIDENKYLQPPHGESLAFSPEASFGIQPAKKKFGGSLRKLFRRRSSSKSSRQNELNDLGKLTSDTTYDRLSIDGDRPDDRVSRSSFERDMTPPHHRPLSQNNSYGSQFGRPDNQELPPRSETMHISTDDSHHLGVSLSVDRNRHYSLPSQKKSMHLL